MKCTEEKEHQVKQENVLQQNTEIEMMELLAYGTCSGLAQNQIKQQGISGARRHSLMELAVLSKSNLIFGSYLRLTIMLLIPTITNTL